MTIKTRTLLDSDNGIYTESLDINEIFEGPNGSIPFRITKRRLRGGSRDGVDIIEVDNGRFCFTIVPTRGMGLWRGRCGDVELKWNSGVHGPIHPKLVPLHDPSGLGWLEGFDEWLVRCGLESNGAPEFNEHGVLKYGLHGRIANIPARRVKVVLNTETGEISITGVVEEARALTKRLALYVTYSTFVGSSRLTVKDMVRNRASVPSQFELLYHINTGAPFAGPGAKYMIPFEEMCPRNADAAALLKEWDLLQPSQEGSPETCYLFELAKDRDDSTRVLLINPKANRGISLSFSKKDFPHFLIWKMNRPDGDPYVAALEPCVNFPNTRSFEEKHGRVVELKPYESRSFEINIDVLHDYSEISETIHHIQRLQAAVEPRILEDPRADWCE
ncbi:MAG: DUF4432 family protein [Planctomycetia bacterium]|nr:DUF4432 family protein [Planctomycetia bacterium]